MVGLEFKISGCFYLINLFIYFLPKSTAIVMLKVYIEMDCGCGAQAALPTMRFWVHDYLGTHMGRDWGKRRREGGRHTWVKGSE